MAKKTSAKKKAKKPTKAVKRVTKTPADHLKIAIEFSERSITGKGGTVDEFFIQQTARLKRELAELEAKNG